MAKTYNITKRRRMNHINFTLSDEEHAKIVEMSEHENSYADTVRRIVMRYYDEWEGMTEAQRRQLWMN